MALSSEWKLLPIHVEYTVLRSRVSSWRVVWPQVGYRDTHLPTPNFSSSVWYHIWKFQLHIGPPATDTDTTFAADHVIKSFPSYMTCRKRHFVGDSPTYPLWDKQQCRIQTSLYVNYAAHQHCLTTSPHNQPLHWLRVVTWHSWTSSLLSFTKLRRTLKRSAFYHVTEIGSIIVNDSEQLTLSNMAKHSLWKMFSKFLHR